MFKNFFSAIFVFHSDGPKAAKYDVTILICIFIFYIKINLKSSFEMYSSFCKTLGLKNIFLFWNLLYSVKDLVQSPFRKRCSRCKSNISGLCQRGCFEARYTILSVFRKTPLPFRSNNVDDFIIHMNTLRVVQDLEQGANLNHNLWLLNLPISCLTEIIFCSVYQG